MTGHDFDGVYHDSEEAERRIAAVQRGEEVEGMSLDPMNQDDPEAIPRSVRGIRDRRHHIYWHSWIADTRPDGMGVSLHTPFNCKIRMFCSDQGDLRRTNMHVGGQLVSDRTMYIERFGIHVSFSDPRHYAAFWRCCRLTFSVGNKPVLELPASYFAAEDKRVDPLELDVTEVYDPPKPSYEGGYCGFLELTRKIALPSRQGFDLLMEFDDKNFVREMQMIENGAAFAAYAEITTMLEGQETREVL